MARVTRAILDQLVRVIITNTGDQTYYIEYAYNKPRLFKDDPRGGGGVVEVSPRLSARDLEFWLEGFVQAIVTTYPVKPRNPPVAPKDIVAMVNPDGEPVCIEDVKVTVWEERDRLHIAIVTNDEQTTVVEWWDDDARQMFDDGFFTHGRDLTGSVLDYAEEMGWLTDDCEEEEDE